MDEAVQETSTRSPSTTAWMRRTFRHRTSSRRTTPQAEAVCSISSMQSVRSVGLTGGTGTGNIVPNENAAAARAAQDVDTPAHHSKELKGTHHWGRGGEGNMVTLGGSNGNKKERTASKGEAGQRRPSFSGVMERGKSMLGMGKKEGAKNGGSSSAVEEEK